MTDILSQSVWVWLTTHGARVLLILLVAVLIYRIIQAIIGRIRRVIEVGTLEHRKQAVTLIGICQSASFVVIVLVASLMLLTELGLDITPLIAGASIVGLAISLGAQTFFRDLIGGLFIVVEDQFHYGDYIEVGAVTGEVERITLRATYLRDRDGTLHIIPNGDIRVVSNRTAGFSRAMVDVTVPAAQDTQKIFAALEAVAREANENPVIKPNLLEPLQVLGLEALDANAMRVRVWGKTLPGQQWDVSRALRLRIKERFDTEGITLAKLQDASTGGAKA